METYFKPQKAKESEVIYGSIICTMTPDSLHHDLLQYS